MNVGDRCKGFKVLAVVPVEECNSTGIWLKHERTGLEVFHLLNDDEENLFSFAFRTPPVDSTGAAHVLEHSVLCGSEKYPLKDPFVTLLNQSVKTFLNAMTGSDKTMYPASSVVKADYFNLMSVYGDAVFFPNLKPEIFMQEAHHLEVDEKGNPTLQGVVYNEMKGAYSSFDSVASDIADSTVFNGSPYVHDSGGDPLVIPTLTHAQLKAFHKKYYCPANCLLFLCGNIPTEEQLSFVSEKFLSRIKDGGKRAFIPATDTSVKIKPFVHEYGPADDDAEGSAKKAVKSTVMVCWKTTKTDENGVPSFRRILENAFLDELLCGDDSAPVSKVLVKSKLGEDIAPQTGASVDVRENAFFIALRGVEDKNIQKVEACITKELAKLAKDGVSEADFDRTCMSFDFDNREVKRMNGPFSLFYMRRCLRSWVYGGEPWIELRIRTEFDAMKKEFKADPNYLKNLIKELLVENKNRSLVVITPSASWSKKRAAQEKKIAKALLSQTSVQKVNADLQKLHTFQQKKDTPKLQNCIPHLKRTDLTVLPPKITTKVTDVKGLPYFVNKEHTNGIVYVDVALPVDVLAPADYPYAPLLAATVTEMGWGKKNWEETLALSGRTTGTFTAYTKTGSLCMKQAKESYEGRDWIIFFFKMVVEKTAEAFDLVADCISDTHFTDTKRLTNVITAYRNDGVSSLVPSSHLYAEIRSICKESRNAAITEIWNGVSSLYTEKEAVDMPAKVLASRFERMFAEVKKGGAVIHVTADKEGLEAVENCLPSFINKAGLTSLKKKRESSDNEFYALTEVPKKYEVKNVAGKAKNAAATAGESDALSADETFIIPGNVGFASANMKCALFNTQKGVHDSVFACYLEKTMLWEQIRTIGGAYGVMFGTESAIPNAYYLTYRDPRPFQSLVVFQKCLKQAAQTKFTDEMVEKTIIGCYSNEIQPKTPAGRGGTGFLQKLYCRTYAEQLRGIKWIISINSKELTEAAQRFAKQPAPIRTVVLCGSNLIPLKKTQTTGKILKLPL